MKKNATALSVVLISSMLFGLNGAMAEEKKQDDPLYPAYINFKFGFINKEGKQMIAPQFSWVGTFSEGLAPASGENGKVGFIDRTGKFVIQPVYESVVDSFTNGIAHVSLNDDVLTIDKTGKAMGPNPDKIGLDGYYEGLAAVLDGEKWGFIDEKGNWIVKPTYDMVGRFSEGLAAVSQDNAKQGYIDKTGKLILPAQYSFAGEFHEGKAAVTINDKMGFIDKTGKVVIQPNFFSVGDFTDGLAPVEVQEGETYKYGLINAKGEYVVKPVWDALPQVIDGLVYVDNKLFDKTGKQLLEAQGTIYPFQDGLAEVSKDLHSSYIDMTGKTVWTESRDYALGNGATLVEKKQSLQSEDSYMYYPQVTGLKDTKLQDALNKTLVEKFAPKIEEEPDLSFSSDYRVVFQKNNILNIIGDSYSYYIGAAHGMPGRDSVVLDMATGKTIGLKDLFKAGSDYKKVSNTVIKDGFKSMEMPLLEDFESIEDDTAFYLTKNGIVVYFQPYEYTPYAAGFPEFEIPYSTLKPYLAEQHDFWKEK
ncbi:WG repeat-containing protein [Brevibacillus fluminis]|nr:WG repeat-containing protein [Brevibacillus fluminis]